MAWMTARIVIASSLLAALAGAAAAAPGPVGSLCNSNGRIEVFQEVASTACVDETDKEMKALFKARSEFQGTPGLSPEKRAQIDARIERRIRELRRIKTTAKAVPAGATETAHAR